MREKIRAAVADKLDRDIIIIGKGPSIDKIAPKVFEGHIVINTNDSEVIYPGDIAVFHHGWVLDRFDYAQPQCRLYVTDREMPTGIEKIHASFVPYSPETADFLLDRFFSRSINIEHAIVISALRVADEIGRLTGTKKRVYLLGFDFSTEGGFSSKIQNSTHGMDDAYIERLVSGQEKILQMLLSEKERLAIDIFHVGAKPYSFYSVDAFNSLFSSRISTIPRLDQAAVSEVERQVKVVAEITTNHFGDRQRLEAMICAAKRAGADYIKLQKRNVNTFYTQEQLSKRYTSPFGNTFGDYRQGIELDHDDFVFVDTLCKSLGIGWFVSVLDKKSFDFIQKFQPELIKIPSTISDHKDFLRSVAESYNGELVVSTGFTDKSYEHFVLDTFCNSSKIYLLQCTSAYPSPMEHTQIGVVRHYYNLSKTDHQVVPGFSSHDIGSICSMMAVAAGAKMIEKHVKFGDVSWSHFDEVAVDLINGDFDRFVSDVRKAERIVGAEEKAIHIIENHKYWVNQTDK